LILNDIYIQDQLPHLRMKFLFTFIILLFMQQSFAQQQSFNGTAIIRLNQIGFYPVLTNKKSDFYLQTPNHQVVFTGKLLKSVNPDFAGNDTYIADFSSYHQPGKYRVVVPGIGSSYPFEIKTDVYRNVGDASIKAYYFMRASTPLLEKYAGKWHRAEGHPAFFCRYGIAPGGYGDLGAKGVV
jgi:endoglucanase